MNQLVAGWNSNGVYFSSHKAIKTTKEHSDWHWYRENCLLFVVLGCIFSQNITTVLVASQAMTSAIL